MSNNKKDLTRIEDLGEFIHELNADDEVPEFPSENDDTDSEENPFGLSFESSEDSKEDAFDSNDFNSSSDFSTGDFSSNEFNSTDFSSFPEESETLADEEETKEVVTSDWNSQDATPASLEEAPPSEEVSFTEDTLAQPEPEPDSEPESYVPEKEYKTPETFEDLRKFSEASSFSGMAHEGNPSFSVLIKDVRFIEDVNDIVSLLRELKLMADSEEATKNRLLRGMLLIPRISEFAAIFLAHKLRRFDIDIEVGLSDEIHPPKHQEAPETGIVSKFSLFQNQSHHFEFDQSKLDISQIIIASTPTLDGHQIIRYLGVAAEHKILDANTIEDESSSEVPRHYHELAQKLKAHALKANANAVIGLNYQLTPLPSEFGISGSKYRLSCTGNLVWTSKL